MREEATCMLRESSDGIGEGAGRAEARLSWESVRIYVLEEGTGALWKWIVAL